MVSIIAFDNQVSQLSFFFITPQKQFASNEHPQHMKKNISFLKKKDLI